MSKNNKKLNYKVQSNLPKINIKTDWDLETLYYLDEHDPQIEKDVVKTEKAYRKFAKKWRTQPFEDNIKLLNEALTDYEKLSGTPESSKPTRYLGLRSVLNSKDEESQKKLTLLSQRLRKVGDEVLFFSLRLGKISKEKQNQYLNSTELRHFHYYLKQIFLSSKHDLSEAEEKIIKLKSPQAHGRWIDATEKILSNRTIEFKGKKLHLPEALETLNLYKDKDRKKLWSLLLKEMKQIGEVAEHEFNAIITDVNTEDKLRGYKKPYSATAIAYEDDEKSIENLVSAVSDTGFKLSRKYYKQKAKLKGVDALHYTEKYDPLGKLPEIPFAQAVEICRDVFYRTKTEYGEIFDNMLQNGQVDVFPKAGKRGGAFMSDQTGHPVQVMLNHTPTMQSLETLAHEMGHAIHAHRSASQTPFYDGHSITTAETASTLFENLVFDAILEQVPDNEKIAMLDHRINRDIATIQRQIACFNCELEMHNTIVQNGGMTNDELRACMQRHLESYLGPAVKVEPEDGYTYVYWSHLRYGFYVYTYAFGILMSNQMANKYKSDNKYISKIDEFLLSGASDNVANIFKKIGFNTRNPEIFKNALENNKKDIEKIIKLTNKQK